MGTGRVGHTDYFVERFCQFMLRIFVIAIAEAQKVVSCPAVLPRPYLFGARLCLPYGHSYVCPGLCRAGLAVGRGTVLPNFGHCQHGLGAAASSQESSQIALQFS